MLGVDYVDIYQFHNVNAQEKKDRLFCEGGSLEWMQQQVKSGKIRFPAFSSHSVAIALEIMRTDVFDVVQLPLNYVDREAEKAVGLARELDMGFIAMKPMGGGLLDQAGPAFRFLMQIEGIVPDPGIERIEELREIVAIVEAGEGLTDSDEAEMARVREELGSTWCHRCDYCQPCPQGIRISSVLPTRSTFKRFNAAVAHAMTDEAIEQARGCTECGSCLPRCPYGLDIPKLLKENIAFFDTLPS